MAVLHALGLAIPQYDRGSRLRVFLFLLTCLVLPQTQCWYLKFLHSECLRAPP